MTREIMLGDDAVDSVTRVRGVVTGVTSYIFALEPDWVFQELEHEGKVNASVYMPAARLLCSEGVYKKERDPSLLKLLGKRKADRVTGLVGIVTSIHEHLHSPPTCYLQPVDITGKSANPLCVYVEQLSAVID